MELESFKEDPDSTSVHSSIKEYNTNQTDQEGMIQNVFHSFSSQTTHKNILFWETKIITTSSQLQGTSIKNSSGSTGKATIY